MAAAVSIPPLAPRPSPPALAAWPNPRTLVEGKENQTTVKPLQRTTSFQRSRRERPCDGCRRRKSKCVLQESRRCVLCEFHKQDCTFVEEAQPRKRKADSSPKSDEPLPPSKKKIPSPSAANTTQQTSPAGSPPAEQLRQQRLVRSRESPMGTSTLMTNPTAAPNTTATTAISSSSSSQFQRNVLVDESLSLQSHRHCKYLGQTTALDSALIGLGTFDDKNETQSSVGTLRQVTGSEYFSTHADADVRIPDDEARALAEIEQTVGAHGPALIEIYFRIVHPSYPIIQKQAFLDRHLHGDRQFNPPLLAAMYLLALTWWDNEPSVSAFAKPDVSRLEYIAITSLTIAMQRPKISAVQAGLLLLQRAKSSTWTLTVQLVALGQDVGLHLDCSEWSIPLWERRLRKRLAWALYMQDKWSAVMHGRPSHINAADWNVPEPAAEDFDESLPPLPTPTDEDTDPAMTHGRTCFIQMIALTGIMAEVCETFYSETAKAEYARAGRYATQLVLNRAKPVQIKLKDWFSRLPAECKMDNILTGPANAVSEHFAQGYLHLAYFATEISIHRRIVQSLSVSPPPNPTAVGDAAPTQQQQSYMLFICRSAAKTRLISALDFVNRLRPAHLNAFWFFASTFNFALIGTFGALLQATSPAKEEAEFYSCRLNEFRWTLSVSTRKAPWIRGAVDMLEANTELLRSLPEKPAASTPEFSRDFLPMTMASASVLPHPEDNDGAHRLPDAVHVMRDEFDEDDDDDDDEDMDDEDGDAAQMERWNRDASPHSTSLWGGAAGIRTQ